MKRVCLARLSVCECGYPLLDEAIPLGTEYLIDEMRQTSVTLTCGGCKREIPLRAVWTFQRADSEGGFLPEMVFEDL